MRPTSDADSDVRDTHRETVHPEGNVPSPSPWAEVPGQREPDHDGQLYVGAAHPDTDLTPDEAAHHEPVPVDETGEPIDRADDEAGRDDTARDDHTADETAAHDETAAYDETAAHDEAAGAHDEAARTHDEAAHAHEEAAHAHDEPTAFGAAHDEPAHDEPTEAEAAHDERAPAEPPHMEPIPIGAAAVGAAPMAAAHHEAARDEEARDEPAEAVAVPADRDEPAEPPAEPAPDGAATELRPGDVPVAAVTAFLSDTVADDLRHRWREAQFGFVDDPRQAAEDVRNLVNEAIDAVMASLSSQRDSLGGPAGEDTEQYRVTVQRCRALFDRLLNL
jgi:hypothetical protein